MFGHFPLSSVHLFVIPQICIVALLGAKSYRK